MKGKRVGKLPKKVSHRSVQEAQLRSSVGGSSFMLPVGEVPESTINTSSGGCFRLRSDVSPHT